MITIHDALNQNFNPRDEYALHIMKDPEAEKAMGGYKIIFPKLEEFSLQKFTSKEDALTAYTMILARGNRGLISRKPAPITPEQAAFAFDYFIGIVCGRITKLQQWLATLYQYEDTPSGHLIRITLTHTSFPHMPMWMLKECESRLPFLRPVLEDCLNSINQRRVIKGLGPMELQAKYVEKVQSASYIFLPEKSEGT